MRLIISLITAAVVFSGCGPPPRPAQDIQAVEDVRRAAAQRSAEERQQAEARLREQEARTSRWQFATAVAVSVSAFALIIGTILGSRARHDGEH